MKNLFSIGEFSKIKNVSIDTLRYYDKINLLKPEKVDKNSSYRYYSYSQLMKYDIIKFCRSVDMSIKEIQELFKESNSEAFQEHIALQKQLLYAKVQTIHHAIHMLDNITDSIALSQEVAHTEGFYIRELPLRKIAYSTVLKDKSMDVTWKSAAYSTLIEDLSLHNISIKYQGGYLYHLNNAQISSSTMFEVLSEPIESTYAQIATLPSGRYLCLSFKENDEEQSEEKFFNELHRLHYNPELILKIYLINGDFHVSDRKFELQCLIKE